MPIGVDREVTVEDRSAWLRDARHRQGMTQEKLAAMASVSIRTVQRAEEGKRMSSEVWKDFEAVLGSGPILARRVITDGTESNFFRKTYKPLKRLRTAKDLLEAVHITSAGKLDYDVEPTAEIFPVLKRAVEFLEPRMPQPWNSDRRRYRPANLVQQLEDETALNGLIDELHGIGVSIYYESYWEDIIYPKEDDFGGLYVADKQEAEARILLHVMLSASDKDTEPFPEVMSWGVDVVESDDNEVPF